MMQAIVTKYHGPTNHRGARVTARAQAGRVTIPWSHELDIDENHRKAATVLAFKFGWSDHSDLVGGALPDDTGYCFVMVRKGLKDAQR